MPQLFQRQTLNREVTGLVGPQQAPPVDTGQGGVPGLGVQGVPQPPPPEVQTQNLQIQGPNRGINLIGDFLSGFGGGPGAVTQQQAQRSAQTERLFGAQQQQVNLKSQLAQQTFQNRLAQGRFDLSKKRLELTEKRKVPSSFGQLAVQTFLNGDIEGSKAILEFSRKSPGAIKQRIGRDLVLLDPSTLKEIRRRKNVFPPDRTGLKLAKGNKLGQIASALLLKATGNVEEARNEAIALAQKDPSGFAAKNLDKLLRAINSTSLRSSKTIAEILLQLVNESKQ